MNDPSASAEFTCATVLDPADDQARISQEYLDAGYLPMK
jgi:hypothetical protein